MENNNIEEIASAKTASEQAEDEVNAAEDHVIEDLKSESVGEAVDSSAEEDYKEKYYYLAAEMQNMQKRFDREKQNLLKFGTEKILNDMLDVLDNFERTLGFIENDETEAVKNIYTGLEMIKKLFLDNLEKHGLKQIAALGSEFDPHFHEALAQQAAEGKKEMEIIQVHQNGYTLNDRVIRAAKVIVAKND